MNWAIDLTLIETNYEQVDLSLSFRRGLFICGLTPSALSGTSPKYDVLILAVIKTFSVVFGGGRVGAVLRKSRCFLSWTDLSLIETNYEQHNLSLCVAPCGLLKKERAF